MLKTININESIYNLTNQYPKIIDILYNLGLKQIKIKMVRKTVGKSMTIKKAISLKDLNFDKVKNLFMKEGFLLVDNVVATLKTNNISDRIKYYLKRLNNGEKLDDVKHDFMKEFKTVKTEEIISAEQDLLKEGFKIDELKQLCDVHKALFKEQIKREDKYIELIKQEGHPLYILHKENELIKKTVDEYRKTKDRTILEKLRQISKHYHKKGDLLYPLLKEKYDISGPSDIMWTKDIEIRNDLVKILKEEVIKNDIVEEILTRIIDMIDKEENIFLPTCAKLISYDDFMQIKKDLKDYPLILGLNINDTEEKNNHENKTSLSTISITGGSFTLAELEAMLNTMPYEITLVDANDINKYFNIGPKLFKRPSSALGRSVWSCHPPKVLPMVKNIIDSFKDGTKDKVEVFMNKEDKKCLVSYYALREAGKYLGTMELVIELDNIIDKYITRENK